MTKTFASVNTQARYFVYISRGDFFGESERALTGLRFEPKLPFSIIINKTVFIPESDTPKSRLRAVATLGVVGEVLIEVVLLVGLVALLHLTVQYHLPYCTVTYLGCSRRGPHRGCPSCRPRCPSPPYRTVPFTISYRTVPWV